VRLSEIMQKTIKAVIIINWKTGKVDICKRKKNKPSPYDVSIDCEFTVNIPEIKPYVMKANVDVSEAQVKDAMLEEL